MADLKSRFCCIRDLRRSSNKVVPSREYCFGYQITPVPCCFNCVANQSSSNSSGNFKDNKTRNETSKYIKHTHDKAARMAKLYRRMFKNRRDKSPSSTYQDLSAFNNCDYPFNISELDNISCCDSMTSDWSLYTSQRDGIEMNVTVTDFNITEARSSTPTIVSSRTSEESVVKHKQQHKKIYRQMKQFKRNSNHSTLAVL